MKSRGRTVRRVPTTDMASGRKGAHAPTDLLPTKRKVPRARRRPKKAGTTKAMTAEHVVSQRRSRKAEADEAMTPMRVAPRPSGKGARSTTPTTLNVPPSRRTRKAGTSESLSPVAMASQPGGEEVAMPALSTKKGMPPPAAVVPKKSRAMEPMFPKETLPVRSSAVPADRSASTTAAVPASAAVVSKKARALKDTPPASMVPEQGEDLASSNAPPMLPLPDLTVVSRKKARAKVTQPPIQLAPGQGGDTAKNIMPTTGQVPVLADVSTEARGRLLALLGHRSLGGRVPYGPEPCLSTSSGMPPLADVISSIRELHRERQDYHSAEKRLTLQIKSIQRRVHARTCPTPGKKKCACKDLYDVMPAAAMVLSEQEGIIHKHRLRPERELRKLAEKLPVWPWVESVTGFGALGFAQIVAECGDLSRFANPAKLWTRMGLGRYQRTDGTWERQRKAEGENGVLAQYSPTRRSIMYVIGDCIIKAGGAFRAVYDVRKLFEAEKPSCGRPIASGGQCEDPERPGHCKPGHIHNRAKRFMEKRLLRDLWREWRARNGVPTNVRPPDTHAKD